MDRFQRIRRKFLTTDHGDPDRHVLCRPGARTCGPDDRPRRLAAWCATALRIASRFDAPPMSDKVQLTSELANALRTGQPVLALESTLIAHGMPWPQNVETALAV